MPAGCPKLSYTDFEYNPAYANSADLGSNCLSSLIIVYIVHHSIKYFVKQIHKKEKWGRKMCNKVMVNVLKFHTPVSEKMAYAKSIDQDQTAPTLFTIPLRFFKKPLHKKQNVWSKTDGIKCSQFIIFTVPHNLFVIC